MSKNTLRAQRRAARAARLRNQRIIVAVIAILVIAFLAYVAYSSISQSNATRQAASASTSTAAALNAAATGTALVQSTSTVATATAASAALGPAMDSAVKNAPGTASTAQVVTTPDGLRYQDVTVGTGTEVKAGSTATVNYTGWLTNGTKFDSSLNSGRTPFDVQNVGSANVIQGWNEGLIGMKVGGKRKLFIPPDLGYGAQANGSIPANSILIFEIDLLSVK